MIYRGDGNPEGYANRLVFSASEAVVDFTKWP